VLDLELVPEDEAGDAARRRARRLQKKYRRAIVRLEQMADAASCRQLTKERALAVLYGRRLRYLIRDSEVSPRTPPTHSRAGRQLPRAASPWSSRCAPPRMDGDPTSSSA
jgi:hypothetical protein